MNHFHTFKTEQVGQVPETTIHIFNSSQVRHPPQTSPILVKQTD